MNLKAISNYKISPYYHKKLKDIVTSKKLKEIKKKYKYFEQHKVTKGHFLNIYV
jgi:predicted secreted protein